MKYSVHSTFSCFLSIIVFLLTVNDHFVTAYPWDSPTKPGALCHINVTPDVSDLVGTSYTANVHKATLPSGRIYRYVHYPSSQGKPTIFFLHGFPSSSYDWRHQFEYFAPKGYGVVAPDVLGYGGSDKPSDPEAYTLKKQAQEMIALLDCVGLEKAIFVGHDLGSPILSRIVNYYPSWAEKYIFLDIGYWAPGQLSTRANVTASQDTLGYKMFFNENGTGYVLDKHQDSIWSISYTDNDPVYWKNDFAPTGRLEAFLRADRRAPTGGFISPKDEAIHNRIFAPSRGGYEPTLNHYRALYRDLNRADDDAIPASAINLTHPVLLITASRDPIGTPSAAERTTRPFAPDLQILGLDSGHFVMLEKAHEVNEAIGRFVDGV